MVSQLQEESLGVQGAGVAGAGARRQRNRRGQGSRLRDELIAAARELLMTAEREQDVSIRAVTRAAGTSPQSFYLQFESLDELLYAVYEIEFGGLRTALEKAAEGAADPVASLLAVCKAYCDYAEQYPGRYRALTGVRGQPHPDWQAQSMPGSQTFAVLLHAVATALQATQRAADPFLVTVTLWASLHGIVTLRADRPAFAWPSLDDMIDNLVRQVLA
jgi:AcrR family transcriptional regulator